MKLGSSPHSLSRAAVGVAAVVLQDDVNYCHEQWQDPTRGNSNSMGRKYEARELSAGAFIFSETCTEIT